MIVVDAYGSAKAPRVPVSHISTYRAIPGRSIASNRTLQALTNQPTLSIISGKKLTVSVASVLSGPEFERQLADAKAPGVGFEPTRAWSPTALLSRPNVSDLEAVALTTQPSRREDGRRWDALKQLSESRGTRRTDDARAPMFFCRTMMVSSFRDSLRA